MALSQKSRGEWRSTIDNRRPSYRKKRKQQLSVKGKTDLTSDEYNNATRAKHMDD